jgi:biopolymer transport protein ExbD
MNFRRGHRIEEVEINLIPLIDVMLVIIIFLMLTTTYSKYSGMEINLPTSESPATAQVSNEIDVAVTAAGDVQINHVPVPGHDIAALADALKQARPKTDKEPVVIISADAKTTHQSVIDVMQAAQQAGMPQITFATQASSD